MKLPSSLLQLASAALPKRKTPARSQPDVRAKQSDDLSFLDLAIDPINDFATAVDLHEAVRFEQRHAAVSAWVRM